MSQDPNTIPDFDSWRQSRAKDPGKRAALLWGADRKGHKHHGEDFGGGTDEPVAPEADGEVIFAGPNGNMGNTVKVRHSDGYVSVYGHLNSITAKQGAKVAKGEQVGLLGATGNAKGPHVHYEVYNSDNLPVNPRSSPYRQPVIGRATRNLGLRPTNYDQPKDAALSVPSFDEFVAKREKAAPEPARVEPATVPPSTLVIPRANTRPRFAGEPAAPEGPAMAPAAVEATFTPGGAYLTAPGSKLQGRTGGAPPPTATAQPGTPPAPVTATFQPGKQYLTAPLPGEIAGTRARVVTPPPKPVATKRVSPTPKPEAVIVQQAVRNPDKLQKDLLWHYGPTALEDFAAINMRDKQKMILYATQQAARDEIKKEQGQTLTEDAGYQAKMRARVPGLKNRKPAPAPTVNVPTPPMDLSREGITDLGDPGLRPKPFDPRTFAQTIKGELGMQPMASMYPDYDPATGDVRPRPVGPPLTGMGEVRAHEGEVARTKSIVDEEIARTGPGLAPLRIRLQQRGLPPEIVGRTLIALDPSLNNQVSVMQSDEENARILGEREAEATIKNRVDPWGNKLGAVAQQWPAFLGYVQDLGSKAIKLVDKSARAMGGAHGFASVELPDQGLMSEVGDYLANRAAINQQIGSYQPKDRTFMDTLTRAGVGGVYSVARIAATVEITGLSLPTVLVGESLIINSDKDAATQTKEAAKAYAFGWALTKLPVLAQKGLGGAPGAVGRTATAHPEAVARAIGGTLFGGLGVTDAKLRGASNTEALAEGVTGTILGAGLAGGGVKRIGEHVKRAPDVVIASSRAPEWMREAAGKATGKKPAVVQSEAAEGETPRFASVYVNPKTGEHITREVSAQEAGKLLGRDRPAKIVPKDVFSEVLGPTPGAAPAPAPVPNRFRLGTGEKPTATGTETAPQAPAPLTRRERKAREQEIRTLKNQAVRAWKAVPEDTEAPGYDAGADLARQADQKAFQAEAELHFSQGGQYVPPERQAELDQLFMGGDDSVWRTPEWKAKELSEMFPDIAEKYGLKETEAPATQPGDRRRQQVQTLREERRGLKRERREMQRQLDTDDLTGIANQRAWNRAKDAAEADTALEILSLDINNFKVVNDELGHGVGDTVLQEAANAARQGAQEHGENRVFRSGGDEITLAVPKEKAEAIRTRIEALFPVRDVAGFPVSISVGRGQNLAAADLDLNPRKAAAKGEKVYRTATAPAKDSTIVETKEPTKMTAQEIWDAGQNVKLMGTDAHLSTWQTHEGIDYEYYTTDTGEALIRVFDQESGNVVSLNKYPNAQKASEVFRQSTTAAKAQAPGAPTAPQPLGKITPKKIVKHSDPNIDGGEVIGVATDGRLKIRNKEGGISLIFNPRTDGNQNATVVKATEPEPSELIGGILPDEIKAYTDSGGTDNVSAIQRAFGVGEQDASKIQSHIEQQRFESAKPTQPQPEAQQLATGVSVFRRPGTDKGGIISPSATNAGKWRLTRFDSQGFSGHEEHLTREGAERAASKGYKFTEPMTEQEFSAMASTEAFAAGNELTQFVAKSNRGEQLTPADQTRIDELNQTVAQPIDTGEDLGGVFDSLIEGMSEPTGTEAAATAVRETVAGIEETGKALAEIFKSGAKGGTFGSGAVFDDETYERAKPHLIAGVKHFQKAGMSFADALAALVKYLRETIQMAVGEIAAMRPYILRFMADWKAGKIDFAEKVAPKPKKVETVSRGRQETQPVREPRAAKNQTLSGTETDVAIPDSQTTYKARYSVREASDVIPSHDPQTFQPNPDYYHVNDRRYESEKQYQMQVIERSKPGTFDARRIANNSPTVDVGPPVIDSDGNVLGGNSRAMIMHRVYDAADQSMANAYRQELTNQAAMYGLDPAQIAQMQRPILVRELLDEHLAQRAITELNRPSTTPLTGDERATAAASQISEEAAEYLTQQLENAGDDASVASVMDAKGPEIINRLIADGVFQAGERNVLIKDGKATPEAKARVERILVSGVYRDLKQMENTPPAVRRNIERIVVPLTKIAGTDWDIAASVQGAIDAVTESKANGVDLDKLAAQGSLAREPYTTNEIQLAKILQLGPRKTAEKFRGYGNDYSMAVSGGGLFGAPTVAESQKIHFGLEAETRTIAPPKPKAPKPTMMNKPPPGGWTDADSVDKWKPTTVTINGQDLTGDAYGDYLVFRGEQWSGESGWMIANTASKTVLGDRTIKDKQLAKEEAVKMAQLPATGEGADDPIARAGEMGRAAFAAGIKAAPALDAALTDLIKTRPKGVQIMALLDAWTKAWHSANLAAPVPGVKMPEPQWWKDRGSGKGVMNQADVLRASGMLERGKTPRKWDALTAEEQHALNEQWGGESPPEGIQPNEAGVYPKDKANKLEYNGGKNAKAVARIFTLQLPDGWIMGMDLHHQQGSFEGAGYPLAAHVYYPTEADAIRRAAQEIVHRQLRISTEANNVVIPKQREQARKMADWANGILASLPPEPADVPESSLTTTEKLFVEIGDRRFPFTTPEDASQRWTNAIEQSGARSSEASPARIVKEDGTEVGHVSYNGRVWDANDHLVFDPQAEPGELSQSQIRELYDQIVGADWSTTPIPATGTPERQLFDEVFEKIHGGGELTQDEGRRIAVYHAKLVAGGQITSEPVGELLDLSRGPQTVMHNGELWQVGNEPDGRVNLIDAAGTVYEDSQAEAEKFLGRPLKLLTDIDAGGNQAQTKGDEQLPQTTSGGTRPAKPESLGGEGPDTLETLPAKPVRGTGGEGGSGTGVASGAGKGKGDVRPANQRTGDGSVSGGRTGDKQLPVSTSGGRADDERVPTNPIDHTIAAADADADKPDRTPTDIIDGAKARALENAEDSATSHPVTLAGDYFIDDVESFSSGSLKQKYQRNIDALTTLRQIQSEGRNRATPEEQATLARWVGWGQFPALMNEVNDAGKEWATERKTLKSLLSDSEWDSAKASIKNAHYTAPQIVKTVWDAVRGMGFTRGRTLEPSMGAGIFFALMPRSMRKFSQIAGVELDQATGQIAKLLYPNADVQIKGFEEYNVSDEFFDLVISNFPFGDYPVADPRYPKRLKAQIHDYFFVKALDKVRPGGLIVGITSTGTLDKQSTAVRDHLAERADLVAAIRLPGNTFLKEAGTAVVTDLIILRKRIPGEEDSEALTAIRNNKWTKVVQVPEPSGKEQMVVNEYYQQHPEMIIGKLERSGSMWRADAQNVTRLDDFEDHLARAVASVPSKVYSVVKLKQFEPQILPAPEELKQGSYTIKDGKLFQKTGEHLHEQSPGRDAFARIEGMIGVRDALNKLLYEEIEAPATASATRKELGRVYDAFVKKHGFINEPGNAKVFADDPDRYRLFALEKWDKKTKKATKTDIFTKATRARYERPTTAKGMVDAVGIALNETGAIDLDRIAGLLSLAPEDIGAQLVAQGVAYNDPKAGWTTRDAYLSGPVRQKLLEAQEAARLDPQYQSNVDALTEVQPQDVPHSKISARMGAPWIPESDIAQFMGDMMGAPSTAFSVRHDKTGGRWYIGYRGGQGQSLSGSVKDTEELGTPQRSFPEIIQAAIDDKPIKIQVKDGDVTYTDKKKSAAANKKVREIRKKFANWIWQDDERRTRLHRQYNQRYNDTIPLKVDGGHQTFPGMNELITLRDNQKDVVWRGVTQGRVMMAHEVGTGKTFSMIAMGMERRRLKLSRKPAIACLNTNVAQVTEAAHLLYPGARILAAHEGMNADTRQKTVTQIATGDWDLVILTHDNLDDIPLSKETQTRFIQKEIEDLKAAVLTAKREAGNDTAGNRVVKDLEKKLATRKAVLQGVLDKPKDLALTFEESGIDFLMVDESHKFKSLPVYTSRGSAKGIPTSRSDRATNMFMRSQWILERNNNQGLVFATGTPISNTLVELFNVQRYLQTPELEARGIDKFDSWAATFAESQTKLEYTPTGDWMPITRFSLFTNLADLSHLASQMMDVAFADEIEGLVRPKRKDLVITVPMSKDQKAYLQSIRARAARLAHAGRPKKGADNWLVLTNDARKAAIDMRLIDRSYPDDPNSKLNRLINEALAEVKNNPTLTQLIFSDMGVNPTVQGISLYDDIIKKLVKGGIPREQIVDFSKFSPGSKTDQRAKAEGMERLSSGKARIGLGGTEKLGTGVNVQELLYNLHHLDAPYRPSDIEQRDGRGWRDQNKNKDIRILRYTTEGSFDTQMWQTLDTKNRFIRSFMRGDITARTMQEEDTEELSYAQIMATTSGNPLLIKKMELEADAAELESDFQVHQDQTFRLKDQMARNVRENNYAEARIKNLTLDAARYAEHVDKDWAVEVKGTTYTRDRAEEETALAHDAELREKNREIKEEFDNAKKAIAHYKNEAKEKGLVAKEQTEYAKAQVPKAFDIVDAFKKIVEGDVEMMPQTQIAAATVAIRDAISKEIDTIKGNWKLRSIQTEEGVSQPFGSFKGFDLVIVGEDTDKYGTALVGPSGEHHTFSWASAQPGQVFDDMEGRISSFDRQAESQRRYVDERTKENTELEPLANKPFAEIAELERLRKAVDLVTQELTASGATLPLPEGYSNLSTRYKADGKLMPEESPLDVHETEGDWSGGTIGETPIFRDRHLVLTGNPPGEVVQREGNWDLMLEAHEPDVRLVPVAIEDIIESVWFDNGMIMPLGYLDIIMANHPKARFSLTNSRRFANTIVVTEDGKTVGYMDVGKPKTIDDDLQPAVRMARERAALEVQAEKKPAEPETPAQATLGDAGDLAGGAGTAAGGGGPRRQPPDPLTSDEDPEEFHAMAMSATRMPLSDVALPGYEKARVPAATVIKAYERILSALGRPTPIRTGRIAQRSALGIYKSRVEVIRLKTANNIATAAHEVGHGIQKAIYGATKARALTVPAAVKRELVALGKALYGTRKPAGGYRTEGFAEFIRLYLTTDDAATTAPNATRWFETQLLPGNEILAQEIRDARKATTAYRMQGAENRAAANMKTGISLRDRIDRAIAATRKVPDFMLDEFSPLFRLTKLAEESQGPLDIMDDPARVASVLRGSATTKVQYMVEDGMLDFASNKVGPPLQDAAAIVKGEKSRFSIYMVAKRAQERWSKNINPGMTREDADALVAQLETPQYELAAQQVYDWNNGILEYVKEASPSFAPLIEKIQRTSQYYVPLARVFDPSEVKGSKTVEMAGGNPLKRMKGSGRAIHDIFPQMIANAEKLIASAHKRRVLDTIVRLSDREGLGHLIEEVPKSKVPFSITTQEAIERLEKMGAQIDLTEADLDEVMTFFTPAQFPKGQEPIVPVMRGGVMRWYYVNPDLYNTLMGMDLYRLPKLWDLLVGVPTRVFRAGTTAYRAAFALFTNPARDIQTFVMQTRSHKNPAELAAYWTRSMGAAFSPLRLVGRRDEMLDTFYRLGAQLGQPLGLDIALTHKTAKRLFRGKIINTVTNPLEVIQEFLSLPESASRVAEIRALASEVGWTPGTPMTEAQAFELALAAKQVTVDFSAAGRLAKIINQCSPFFNAGIQGGRTFARAMRDHPRRSVLRGLLLITIPTLLLWWRNKDKEWYTDMLDRTKHLYWHIEAGEQVIEIPRAFEWGNAFAVIPEVIFDTWYRKDPEGVKAAVGHIFETTTPDVLPVVARNAKEQWQNHIEFFNRPIVPRGEIDLPPGEQRGPYTSRVAVWLGKKFPDTVSPRRVDALIRGFGGGVAPDILNTIGLGSQRGNRDRELSDIPVFGRAFQQGGKSGFGSKALESFYDQLSLVEARASSKDRPETNDQREYRLILEDANAALKVLRTVQSEIPSLAGRQRVTHLTRMIAKTAIDTKLTPAERVAKLEQIMAEQPDTAEKVKAEVEKKRLAKAAERAETAPSRSTFDLPGNKPISGPPRPPGPPSPP